MSSSRHAPLFLLGLAILVACVGLGAPPRMDAVEGAAWLPRLLLESLAPLAVVQALIAAALLVSCLRGGLGGAGDDAGVRLRRPLVLLLCLAVVQILPVPLFAVRLLAPIVGDAQASVGTTGPLGPALSLWWPGTWAAAYTLLGALAASAAVFAAVRGGDASGRRAARRVLTFVLLVALFESAYGIVSTHAGADTILGLDKVSGRGRVTGTFVLAPMLGVWAGMGACAAAGLAALEWVRRGSPWTPRFALVKVAAVVCVVGAALSLSRVMLAATAAGLAVTCWLAGGAVAAAGRRLSGLALRAVALLVPVGGAAAALFVPSFRERAEFLTHYVTGQPGPIEPRFAGWASTWDLFLGSPLIGTGLGSFGRAIHLTQSVDSADEMWFAHSEPLNLLSDAGVVGMALVLWWLARAASGGRQAAGRADPRTRVLAAAALGGAAVVLIGGLADFQTQFAVVAIPFAALLTLPAALVAPPAPAVQHSGTRRRLALAGCAALLVLPLVVLVPRWQHVSDGWLPAPTAGERDLVRAQALLREARASDDPVRDLEEARERLRAAVRAEPMLDEAHLWLALAELSVQGGDRELALAELGRARHVSRGHVAVNLQVGLLYLDLYRTQPAAHGPPGDSAAAALREAGALEPQAFGRAWRVALERRMPVEWLREIVPPRAHAVVTLSDHLRREGRDEEALRALADGLEQAPWDTLFARRVANLYRRADREGEARALFERLRIEWPADR